VIESLLFFHDLDITMSLARTELHFSLQMRLHLLKHLYPANSLDNRHNCLLFFCLQVKTFPVILLPKEKLVDTNGAGILVTSGE
jgi:hypothetical protein